VRAGADRCESAGFGLATGQRITFRRMIIPLAYRESISFDALDQHPPVALAPLAGITDLPFRQLVASFGAAWVVSEMVASQEMVQAKPGVRERAELGFDQHGTAVQIAGREAHWMAEAARMIEANGAAMIDINMGCPAKKVTNGYSGSALLRDPDHALRLIAAVVDAVDIPVTLKTRLGWDHDCLNAADVARRAQDAGIRLVTIHGRTRCQFYKGNADWAAIAQIKDAVTIPVIANGDIVDAATAQRALDLSGAAGVMIGRGAQGRPWVLAQIAAQLHGAMMPVVPQGKAFCDMVSTHYTAMLSFYGKDMGLRVARKHLGWYMDVAGTPTALRHAVLTAPSPDLVLTYLPDALAMQVAA
jgi:tRNA-dihydrouridine synthase B